MKIEQQNKTVTRSGVARETSFNIAVTAQAVDILSSKIYTDPIMAIVRELSTNARDAQVDAGNKDRQFDVHLPNSMNPFFAIRDYGTGLSPQDLETVYTTYFQSTRNDSDEFTGAFGLGSKSPFAYTDMFTVTSFYEGKKYTYSAFKGEKGIPNIALLNEEDTTEHNGLEIRIEVKRNDFADFVSKAKFVYQFFDVRPNVSGAKIEYNEDIVLEEKGVYQVYRGNRWNSFLPGRVNIVMGNVCYEASHNRITDPIGYGYSLVIFAEIGECDISASREEIYYSDKTIETVEQKIENAVERISQNVLNKVAVGFNSDLEKAQAIAEYSDIIQFSSSPIDIYTKVDGEYSLRGLDTDSRKIYIDNDKPSVRLRPGSNTKYIFVENDLPEGKLKQSDRNRLRVWINSQKKGGYPQCYLVKIEDRQKTIKALGQPTIKFSDIPAPPRAQNNSNKNKVGGSISYIKQLVSSSTNLNLYWESVEKEPDTTKAVAVRRVGNYVLLRDGTQKEPQFFLDMAMAAGYNVVYGISDRHFDRISEKLELPNLETELQKYIKKYVKNMNDFERAEYHGDTNVSYDLCRIMPSIKDCSDECKNLQKQIETDSISVPIRQLISMYGLEVPQAENHKRAFYKKYPLLSNIQLHYVAVEDVIEYIELKENQ